MPNFVSPGVYVVEKDISEYPANINSSVVGIVGFASKGPTNKATLVTSTNQLVTIFGKPSEDIYGQGLEGAAEILETTDQVYFVRAADDATAADASSQAAFGGCPAVYVSAGGSPTPSNSDPLAANPNFFADWGITSSLTLRVNVFDKNGIKQTIGNGKDVVIPAGSITDASASLGRTIRKSVGADNDNAKFGAYASSLASDTSTVAIVSHFAGSGSYMTIEACSGTSYNILSGVACLFAANPINGEVSSFVSGTTGVINPLDASSAASSVKVWGSELNRTGAASLSYLAESIYPGAGYNAGTTVAGDTSGNSVEIDSLGGSYVLLTVNDGGAAIENFKVGFVAGANFIETQIQGGEVDLKSNIIKGNIVSGIAEDLEADGGTDFSNKLSTCVGLAAAGTGITGDYKITRRSVGLADTDTTVAGVTNMDPRFIKLVDGTYNLAGGNNGIPTDSDDKASALIGDATLQPKTGMQALDNDLLNISIGIVPGVNLDSVQNNLITLAETSQNFIAVVSPPYAVGTTQDAVDWHNGLTSNRGSAINNSYAAIYWPWVQMFSVFDRKDIWMDPAVYGVRQMAFNDSVGEVWFAPAGYQRGRLSKPLDVEVDLNRGDLNTLYSGGNAINPIVNFPQQGITIWGQRTSQREPTALDRINIRRMLVYIRKVILQSTRRFVFEPNDLFLWAQIENVLNPFLDDIANRRGIKEFRVVCDESTNTPVRVDRNEMWCKVLIRPTKTAEVLVFELNLTNQSADLGKL